jgi:putative membrane protein
MEVTELPKLYTIFNACALVHIILGLTLIKMAGRNAAAVSNPEGGLMPNPIAEGFRKGHIASMSIALLFSTAFLGCYLYYHYHAGHVKFAGTGLTRPIYFTILFTHIPLAVLSLPMIIMTVVPALRSRFDSHKRIARWTVPVWLYVSVTGVIVYLMCYVWYGPPIRT